MTTHNEKEELASFWDAEALTLSPPTIKTYYQLKADQICPSSINETAPRTSQNLTSFISSPSVDLTSSLDRLITLSETAATLEERAHALSIIDRLVQQDAEEKEIVRERSGNVQGFVCALLELIFGALAILIGTFGSLFGMLIGITAVFLAGCIIPAVILLFLYGLKMIG